jgi:hypothetical protein
MSSSQKLKEMSGNFGLARRRAGSVGQGSPKSPIHRRTNSGEKFHRMNTVANLYQKVFGFEAGYVLCEVLHARKCKAKLAAKSCFLDVSLVSSSSASSSSSSAAAASSDHTQNSAPGANSSNHSASGEAGGKGFSPKRKVRLPALPVAGGGASADAVLTWNQEVQFEVLDEGQSIQFTLLEQSRLKKSEKGTGSFRLADAGSGELIEQYVPLAVKGKPAGEVLIRIQYTSDKDRNSSYRRAMVQMDEWFEVLLEKNLVLVATLCRVYASDELSKTLIRVFNYKGQALRLLVRRKEKHQKRGEQHFPFDVFINPFDLCVLFLSFPFLC